MTITFRTLVTVEVTHEYYAGRCRDFEFLVPQVTARQLQRGRLLAKVLDDRLHLLVEVDDTGTPLVNLAGQTLRLGLSLRNPYFVNFTAPGAIPAGALLVYRRVGGAPALAAAITAAPLSTRFVHVPSRADRPVTVTVTDPDGHELASRTVDAGDPESVLSFDLTGQARGLYEFVEDYPAAVQALGRGYFDPDMTDELFGVVEIEIDAALYAAPQPLALAVPFTTRTETLNYYVVARDLSQQEFNQLTVSDQGPNPKLAFTRVESAAFTPAELPPPLLGNGNGDARIVLFRSTTPTPRQARGRPRLELRRNNVVLIPNLPQPGADRARADLIVHVSKKP